MRQRPGPGEPGGDRSRAHTPEPLNQQLDREMESRIFAYARRPRSELSERIIELDREWDLERLLVVNASALTLLGLVLGARVSRYWLALPALVATFLLQHGLQGWCPPVSLFRRLGVRTRREIDYEKYALEAVRGDFERFKLATAWHH